MTTKTVIKQNKERYPVQAHGNSRAAVDLEIGPHGWPILFAIPEEEKGNCQTSSREFRWAYGREIWLVHSDGRMVSYEGISQCWINDDDQVYSLVARSRESARVDL